MLKNNWADRSERARRSDPLGRSREHIKRKRGPHPSVKGVHPLEQEFPSPGKRVKKGLASLGKEGFSLGKASTHAPACFPTSCFI